MAVTIRRYEVKDIDAILDLVESFLHQDRAGVVNHFNYLDFDRTKVYDILNRRVSDKDFFCSVVVEDGAIVGGLAGSVDELIFSRQLFAVEWLLYFTPSFSSVRVVLRLIISFVTWAKSRNAVEVQIANSSGFKQEKFASLMKLAGFEQTTVGFSRRT